MSLRLKIILWALKYKLKGDDKVKALNALLENIGALPISSIIGFDQDGTMRIKGQTLTAEQMITIRENAVSLANNQTYQLIKNHIAFLAVKTGIHDSLNSDMLLFSKAALWIQAREKELIDTLQGNLKDL